MMDQDPDAWTSLRLRHLSRFIPVFAGWRRMGTAPSSRALEVW